MSESPIQERPTTRPATGDVADHPPMATPSITGGMWVPRSVLILGILAVVALGAGLTLWFQRLQRRAEVAEQGRLEVMQRVDEMRRQHDEDLRKRDRLHEQERVQREREQAVDREKREQDRADHDAEQDELRRERNWLQFENARLRQQQVAQPPPKRIITVR